jgi:CubicO group peptidase (beta-lactamase class C family)
MPPVTAPSPPATTASPSHPAPTSQPPAAQPSIDAFIDAQMQKHHREGLSVAVVKNGTLMWSKGYGFADVAKNAPATPDKTLFLVSSMSKVVMVVAVLQVLETLATQRNVTLASLLDADVDTLVKKDAADPIHVRTPSFPDVPITMRMILTHTSSIQNDYDLIPHDYATSAPSYAHDMVPDLRLVFQRYLVPAGTYYAAGNFLTDKPGTNYTYSSVASSIAALVVDAHMGTTFDAWCKLHVFTPLGMKDTAWRLSDVAGLKNGSLTLAMPYQWNDTANELVSPPIWENTFFPSASLRSTAVDYAKLVAALGQDGVYPGGRLLSSATMAELRRVQDKSIDTTQGLIVYFKKRANFWVLGHGGANTGFRSEASFMAPDEPLPDKSKPKDIFGSVVLTNGDYDADGKDMLSDVESEIFRRALAKEPF